MRCYFINPAQGTLIMNNVVITAAKCGFGLVRSTSDNIIF